MGVGNQGNVGNENGNVVNENIQENVRNVLVNGNQIGCSYKEFLACNPKEYDGKGSDVVITRWIKKMENVQEMSGCSIDQKVKYTAGSFVEFCPSHEIQKLETKLWNHAMVEGGHDAYTDRFQELDSWDGGSNGAKDYTEGCVDFWDVNKRNRTGNAFTSTTNPVGRDNTYVWPKCTTYNSYHAPGGPCRTCFNCNRPGHLAKDCRGVPRNVNPANARNLTVRACYECGSTDHVRSACPRLNRAQGLKGNRPNQVVANNGGQGCGSQGNQARGRAFMLGAKEVHLDPNIMTGIDWLSNHKAEIICHEKVVRIPLPDGKVLRVLEERPKEKARLLMSAKASDKKQEEIVVVRDFPEYPYRLAPSKLKELSGQLKELQDKAVFIDLMNRVCRPYLDKFMIVFIDDILIYSKTLEEHLEHIRHVINGNGIYVDPSKIEAVKNWKAFITLTKCKTFDWGEEQQLAFQTLKDTLCNAPVLALLDGLEDFAVYSNASEIGLGCVLMQRELFSDYKCEIRYHPGKANVVVAALSRKERVNSKSVRAMNMTLQSSIKDRVLTAQKEVPLKDDVRTLIMDEAHKLKYSAHPRADKMYYDLRDMYWWLGMKKDIAEYEGIAMDFVTKLPRTSSGHDTIWVIMNRLTKSAYFLPMREDYKMDRLARLYLNEIIKDRLKAACDRQKSYANKRRKPLEFSVGDYVLLKVSPWKGRVRFRKKGKLAPRFVGPFEIVEKVGDVAYRLNFPKELNGVHDMFHVSNLKKCLADPTLQAPLDEIQVNAKLNYVEELFIQILCRVDGVDFMRIVVAKQSQRKNRLNDHTYGSTSNFCDQSPFTPDPQPKDKELSLEEDFNELFKIIAKNIKGMKQEEDLWQNPTSTIFDKLIANLKAQLVGNEMVRVKIPRCMSWLVSTNAFYEPIGDLGMMDNEVGNTSPQSTQQILPSFEEYTPSLTYPKEVEEDLGTPMKVELLDQTKLDDLGLTNHDILLSSREVPSVDKPELRHFLNFPSLDVNLGDKRGHKPPIKPYSLDCFRMEVVDNLTIHTPHLPHVVSFHPKDVYCYYHPCIDDLKKHYGFKLGLLGQSRSLGDNFSNLEMIKDD
uniref:CCHC-type domain-containing protein n=1 Tax=Tanacetum cinerariifolium TaxID=118510 RepID=A0A6L2LLL1_TANCI|nr:hypothetical protein [Tanacetum cinerariifolium]